MAAPRASSDTGKASRFALRVLRFISIVKWTARRSFCASFPVIGVRLYRYTSRSRACSSLTRSPLLPPRPGIAGSASDRDSGQTERGQEDGDEDVGNHQ